MQPHRTAALAEVVAGRSATVAQVVGGPRGLLGGTLHLPGEGPYDGTLGGEREDQVVAAQARALLRAGRTGRIHRPP
ncbi:XdhC family protein [Streptomyces sp. V4I23]|uniref:XdhC family protein n=1 Tax=Streptomyces sp. V4I23 TaxID=3042282 RepID=UPI0027D7B749|nr:XdhC family protein [Streptomyces sp. V4I23]